MTTIPEASLDQMLGKPSLLAPKKLTGQMAYQHGIPTFDEAIGDEKSAVPKPLNFAIRPEGVEISMMKGFKMHRVGIPFADIEAIELASPGQITTQKEKSIIGRALLGGLLLGPVGAMIGGATALQGGKVTLIASLLTFLVKQGEEHSYFVASVEPKDNATVSKFLQQHLARFVRQ